MSTTATYFNNSYQFNHTTSIRTTAKDETGYYIILDQTIFYPQGGGQPYDLGVVQAKEANIPIHAVKKIDSEIRHYTGSDYSNLSGQEVQLCIDKERRLTNMYFHSAGHLLSHIVEELYPQLQAIKGYHYAEGAYVEFIHHGAKPIEIDLAKVNNCVAEAVRQNYPIATTWVAPESLLMLCPQRNYPADSNSVRIVRFGHYPPQPCGGTHVQSTHELERFSATKQKSKANTIRISYNKKIN